MRINFPTSPRLQAFADLFKRYGAAFRHAWQHRAEMQPTERLPHEAQFLPAALSLQETPVSPAPRVAMWMLIGFALLAVLFGAVPHFQNAGVSSPLTELLNRVSRLPVARPTSIAMRF